MPEIDMPIPIALQLYSIRETLAQDFAGGVHQIAAMGYKAVETAGFPGTTPTAAGALFRELGLLVPSAHVFPPPLGDQVGSVVDTMGAIGCRCVVSGLGPDHFRTLDDVKRSCDLFNASWAALSAQGLTLAVHNHWWEFLPVEGRYPYELMLEFLEPSILFELDTYWIKTAGCDPATVVREFGARAPLLHIKDGPATRDAPMVAVGEGVLDFPAILEAGKGHTQWLIVELDRCATDMMEAVARSLNYLLRIQTS
jgi:sugar phosphate isomerase/epimerase